MTVLDPFRTNLFKNVEQLPRFCTTAADRRTAAKKYVKCVVLPLKFNRYTKLKKLGVFFLSTLVVIHLVLRFDDDGFSGLFRKCSNNKKEKKRKTYKVGKIWLF